LSKGINFGWYLMTWLTTTRSDEATFWRAMNPYRCMVLFNAHNKVLAKPTKPQSLSQYLMGGGG